MIAHKFCILLTVLGAHLVASDPQTVWNGNLDVDPNYVESLLNEDTQQLNAQKFDKVRPQPVALAREVLNYRIQKRQSNTDAKADAKADVKTDVKADSDTKASNDGSLLSSAKSKTSETAASASDKKDNVQKPSDNVQPLAPLDSSVLPQKPSANNVKTEVNNSKTEVANAKSEVEDVLSNAKLLQKVIEESLLKWVNSQKANTDAKLTDLSEKVTNKTESKASSVDPSSLVGKVSKESSKTTGLADSKLAAATFRSADDKNSSASSGSTKGQSFNIIQITNSAVYIDNDVTRMSRQNSVQNQTSSVESNASNNSSLGVKSSSSVGAKYDTKVNARPKRSIDDNKPRLGIFRIIFSANNQEPMSLEDSFEHETPNFPKETAPAMRRMAPAFEQKGLSSRQVQPFGGNYFDDSAFPFEEEVVVTPRPIFKPIQDNFDIEKYHKMDEPAADTFDYSKLKQIHEASNSPVIIQPTNVNFFSFLPMLMKDLSEPLNNNDNKFNTLEDMF